MKHWIILLICLVFIISCKSKRQSEEVHTSPTAVVKEVILENKFFEYDEIDHYSIVGGESTSNETVVVETETKNNSLEDDIISGNTPRNINDTSFISKLDSIGYKKKSIAKEKFAAIDSLFREKSVDDHFDAKCIPFYRDILIFKKQEKIIGIAKICFECDQNQITGTKVNTDNFGQDGDYQKLAILLGKQNTGH